MGQKWQEEIGVEEQLVQDPLVFVSEFVGIVPVLSLIQRLENVSEHTPVLFLREDGNVWDITMPICRNDLPALPNMEDIRDPLMEQPSDILPGKNEWEEYQEKAKERKIR